MLSYNFRWLFLEIYPYVRGWPGVDMPLQHLTRMQAMLNLPSVRTRYSSTLQPNVLILAPRFNALAKTACPSEYLPSFSQQRATMTAQPPHTLSDLSNLISRSKSRLSRPVWSLTRCMAEYGSAAWRKASASACRESWLLSVVGASVCHMRA